MGKAAKLKQIRKEVAKLPKVLTKSSIGGDKELINHSRQMKRLYATQGMKGVDAYVQNVNDFAEQKSIQAKADNLRGVIDNAIDISEKNYDEIVNIQSDAL